MEANQKLLKKRALKTNEGQVKQQHESYLPPYLLINKNALLATTNTIKN